MNSYWIAEQLTQHRHKVFVCYHHANDQLYRDRFESLFTHVYDIMVSKSVQIGDLDPRLNTETLRQKIREEFLSDSTVTVVLVGKDTWRRKHVDWEISASIRETKSSPRSGLLGILLPTYPKPASDELNIHTIPPRLYDNFVKGFAKIYDWSENATIVKNWIHDAFETRKRVIPDNSFPHFINNRNGDYWQR